MPQLNHFQGLFCNLSLNLAELTLLRVPPNLNL